MLPTGASSVLIIGSGVAGLSAALEAARAGVGVTVIEAESALGGASVRSGGASCLVGTPLQEAAGIADSAELALADWRACGGETADMAWAARYIEGSNEAVYHWCADLGIEWAGPKWAEENSADRLHEPVGAGKVVVERLAEVLAGLGVNIWTDSRATSLLRRGTAVCGARVESPRGQADVEASLTIVCAGGFVNDPDLLRAEVPELSGFRRVLCGGWRSARGDGLRLLREVGAAFSSLDRVWMYPVGTPNPDDGQRGLVVRGLTDEIWVDTDGHRFHDENLRGGRSGIAAVRSRAGQTCWGIFDGAEIAKLRLLDDERYGSATESTPEQRGALFKRSRYAWREPTLGELALRIGVPPQALVETVRHYNAAVTLGVDRCFGRDLSDARPIAELDVCAIQYFPVVQKNLGGVMTDLDGHVLDDSGEPIAGLLAAGEVAGMAGGHINGEAALEGTMFGPSLFSGRVAGRTAAAELVSLVS